MESLSTFSCGGSEESHSMEVSMYVCACQYMLVHASACQYMLYLSITGRAVSTS